ncbi:MAG: DUF2225 domain-containing protein [Clostridiales bacterium]|nr:DUF2225 domain-containing protein [Clostridiales bacterium]
MDLRYLKETNWHRFFLKGQPIENDDGEREFYILLKGAVDAYSAYAQLKESYKPGRSFGERHFFFGDEEPTYIAAEDVTVYAISESALKDLLQAYPALAVELLSEAYATERELAAVILVDTRDAVTPAMPVAVAVPPEQAPAAVTARNGSGWPQAQVSQAQAPTPQQGEGATFAATAMLRQQERMAGSVQPDIVSQAVTTRAAVSDGALATDVAVTQPELQAVLEPQDTVADDAAVKRLIEAGITPAAQDAVAEDPVKDADLQSVIKSLNEDVLERVRQTLTAAQKGELVELLSRHEQPVRQSGYPPSFFLPGHKGYTYITHDAYNAFTFEKEMTCPICGKNFTGRRILSSKLVVAKPPRFDLRQYYKDFQTEWFEIVTCPHCYFSTFVNLFLQPKNLSKTIAKVKLEGARKELTMDFEGARTLEFVLSSHYLALLCASAFMNYRQINAKVWGNISWLYEDACEEGSSLQAARNAVDANETIYAETTLTPVQEQIVSLTIAGFLYRLNDYTGIKKWIFQAKTIKSGRKLYADMADDLMDMIRDGEQAGQKE